MSFFQVRAVAICLLINALDGFDILVIAFLAPEIAQHWWLSPDTLGILLSAGLAGMTVGSLLLSPLADRYGRRPAILLSLAVTSLGMVVSAFTGDLAQLTATRFVTGLGIGAMLASLTTIVAEYASDRRRAAAIGFSMAGYPIGAIFGGFATLYLLEAFGWQAVFLFGGLLTGLMIPLSLVFLPESIEYLLTRRDPDTLSALAVCIGLGVNAAVIALYALVADVYPVNIRTTAIGWAIGVGRFSAVLSPAIAGFVLDLGVEEGTLFLIFALPMLLAAGLVLAIRLVKA